MNRKRTLTPEQQAYERRCLVEALQEFGVQIGIMLFGMYSISCLIVIGFCLFDFTGIRLALWLVATLVVAIAPLVHFHMWAHHRLSVRCRIRDSVYPCSLGNVCKGVSA